MSDRLEQLQSQLTARAAGRADVLALVDEACRIADRLDRLNALLDGDAGSWCSVKTLEGKAIHELVIDAPLVEARQQALALRQLLEQIRKMAPDTEDAGESKVSALDDLAAKRAARLGGADGGASASRRSQPRRSNGSHRTDGGARASS